MNSKLWLSITGTILALVILAGTCSAGFVAGRLLTPSGSQPITLLPSITGRDPGAGNTPGGTPEDLKEVFTPFWQAWDLVHDQYVDQPVDDDVMMRGAIRGMLDALEDPHTSYLDPSEYEMLTTQLQGEDDYEGIGAWVDTTGEYLTIISPMPDSPAEKAGLRPGDQIIAIDGEDMTGLDGEIVRKKILGPAGTSIVVTVQREGNEPFQTTVTRDSINVPSVESRMLENDIAYIHLFLFGDKTKQELRQAIRKLLDENPRGMILDLRYNGGGYLQSAVDVASEFINDGVILYEEYGDGERTTYNARNGGLATDIPLVVLINEGSASASEIVAGAIQDHERGLLVGTNSYGKGSVQIPSDLKNEAGAIRITVARSLTPDERTIQEIGLTPDYVVEVTEADLEVEKDPQLEKAKELLS